ncbi:MAG TPA: hypothetical protein GX704_07250 [Clostridiales bacterium]|jgi:hypothetical protein|nr:hypothetical protein [Clostridiales bacterium]
MAEQNDIKYTYFRGKPLVRSENQYIYGDMADPYIAYLMVLSTKKAGDAPDAPELPDMIIVQIRSTDKTKSEADRMVKQFNRSGLYEALDTSIFWLRRFNGEEAADGNEQ